jgi:hypothetical protein
MYLSARAAIVRNAAVALVNGVITLIILLIAPLGLATVIVNTLLVTIASFGSAMAADRTVVYLQPRPQPRSMGGSYDPEEQLVASRRDSRHLDRR